MWTTLKLQVTTPVFNSATPPGEGYLQARPEIRVTSLRGGMRYWLRAMAGTYVGDDLHRLRAVEDRVLGSTKHASPIRLRIPRQPAASEKELRELVPDREQEQWVAYLLGPGLTTKGRAHTKDFIPPDEVFSLQVRLMGNDQESKDAHRCALAALWLNLTYGGLGARVHRGFGGLRVLGAEKGLPWDSDPTLIRSPDLAHYTKAEHLLFTGPAEESREALQRICDVCGGLPGALRLAGAKYLSTPHLTLSQFATLLESSPLDQLSAASESEFSLREQLYRCYEDVSGTARRIFLELTSSDPRGLQVTDLFAGFSGTPNEFDQALGELYNASLIHHHGDGRIGVLRLLRDIATHRVDRLTEALVSNEK